MEFYTKNVTFCLWLKKIFGLKVLVNEKKMPVFSYKIVFILAKEIKNNNHVHKKKHFFMIFEFFGGKIHPGLRYKHEKSIFACKFFFANIYIWKQKQVCNQKRD